MYEKIIKAIKKGDAQKALKLLNLCEDKVNIIAKLKAESTLADRVEDLLMWDKMGV